MQPVAEGEIDAAGRGGDWNRLLVLIARLLLEIRDGQRLDREFDRTRR